MRPIATLVALWLAGAAHAGSPVTVTLTCPVGGESFSVVETTACELEGRTMSFRPVTTCEFITQLPVCPSNGLPMYQEFDDDQVSKLTEFVGSDAFAPFKDLPAWQRAYEVSAQLGQTGTRASFGLLMNAVWFEGESLAGNADMTARLMDEFGAEIARAAPIEGAFLRAIIAYFLQSAGDGDQADALLAEAKAVPDIPDVLQLYIASVEACRAKMESDACQPDAPFSP